MIERCSLKFVTVFLQQSFEEDFIVFLRLYSVLEARMDIDDEAKRVLLRRAGGGDSFSITALKLGISFEDLLALVEAGDILAVDFGVERLIPNIQFSSLQPLPNLRQLLELFAFAGVDSWFVLLFLIEPDPFLGERILILMRMHQIDRVLNAARAWLWE